MKKGIIIALAALCVHIFGCTTTTVPDKKDTTLEDNAAFLAAAPSSSEELFRVVIMSDRYEVTQKSALDTIGRMPDKSGDKFIIDDLAKYDKISESREAILSVSLYPDTGRIMKIRPKRLASLREIDELVVEDLQRWNLISPQKKQISPIKFDVHYRVVLRKKQTDEEIIKEVREKMKEKSNQ